MFSLKVILISLPCTQETVVLISCLVFSCFVSESFSESVTEHIANHFMQKELDTAARVQLCKHIILCIGFCVAFVCGSSSSPSHYSELQLLT